MKDTAVAESIASNTLQTTSIKASPAASQPQTEEVVTLKMWIAVFRAVIGAFMAILDIQITNSSIKEITGGLGATLDDASWISTAYLVADIVIIPLVVGLRAFSRFGIISLALR